MSVMVCSTRWSRISPFLVPAAAVLATVVFRICHRFHIFDDAFITFRYAANIASGAGFVYNEGERVLGTTTPLFTLILAVAARIAGPAALPATAQAIGILADAGTAILLYLLFLRMWANRAMAACATGSLVFAAQSVIHCTSGMESSLFAFLILLALERFTRERDGQALTVGAVALVTRPEAVLLLGLLLCGIWLRRRRIAYRSLIPAILILLPWCLFASIYFGDMVPHSMRAKWQLFSITEETSPMWRFLSLPNFKSILLFWSCFLSQSHHKELWRNVGSFLPVLVLFVLGTREIWGRRKAMLVVPLFAILFSAAYSASSTLVFSWYLVPLVGPMLFVLCAGVKFCGDQLAHSLRHGEERSAGRSIPTAFLLLFCLLQTMVWWTLHWGLPAYLRLTVVPSEREQLYRQAARLVREDAGPKSRSLIATEIGAIGFEALHLRVFDAGGLITPEVKDSYAADPSIRNRVSPALLKRFQPDYAICLKSHFSAGAAEAPEKIHGYEVMAILTGPDWAREGLYVLRRKG